jgi:hypothetical protein
MSADTLNNVGPITVADSGPRSFRDPVGVGPRSRDHSHPRAVSILSTAKNATVFGESFRFISRLQVLYLIYWLVVFSLTEYTASLVGTASGGLLLRIRRFVLLLLLLILLLLLLLSHNDLVGIRALRPRTTPGRAARRSLRR